MPKQGKEFRINFSRNPAFGYINESDKYLFAIDVPKYRINLIGAGMMGHEHLRLTVLEGRAKIHGIYDPNPLSVELSKRVFAQVAPGRSLVVYNTLEDACNDPEVDALIICTPNYTHIDVVRVAAKSGKHILLEKPMATTIEDAHEIFQIAKNYPNVFQIGLQYRYKAIYHETIHEALERKTLGDIKLVNIAEHRVPFLDKVKQWNKFNQYSGGTLVEKCCHYFDLLNLFAGARPTSVYASGSQAVNFTQLEYEGKKSDILDNAHVIVEYANGVRAGFNLCMFAPMFYEEIVICGDEGRLKAYENQDFMPDARPGTHLEIMCGEKKPSRVCTPMYPKYIEEGGHNGATFYEHINFIDKIEGKRTTTATPEEGFWSIIVGAAAQFSIERKEIIHIEDLLQEKDIKI